MRHHTHNRHNRPDRHGAGHHTHERRFARDPLETLDRHHHRSGRRRVFDHGDLRFILLSMVAAKPAHGYDLIKALEERMGGGYSPSPGVDLSQP